MSETSTESRLRAEASGPLVGRIMVPGDKSISHRALILGGMATGETRIEGLLEGDDVLATAAAVRALGAEVERTGEGQWRVRGGPWRSPDAPIDCGNSGTGARLLMDLRTELFIARRLECRSWRASPQLRNKPFELLVHAWSRFLLWLGCR